MKNVLFIHGAGASRRSFNHLGYMFSLDNGPLRSFHFYEYTVETSLDLIIEGCVAFIKDNIPEGEPFSIVGHSLGGIIALAVAHRFPIVIGNVVTMATPFGGSASANVLRWVNTSQMFETLRPNGPILRSLRYHRLPCKVTSLVTTASWMPLFKEPNDGVVTVASQMSLPGAIYYPYEMNHFEILLDEDAARRVIQNV